MSDPDTADTTYRADTARAAFGRGTQQVGSTMEQLAAQRAEQEAKASAGKANAPPLLLALGDSWFAYWPRGDILDVLEDRGQLDTESLAWAGAKLTEVLDGRMKLPDGTDLSPHDPRYREPQTERMVAWLGARSPADRARLKYVAISAGGNDVADENGTLSRLVAAAGGGPGHIDEAAARQLIDIEMRDHFARLLGFVDSACAEVLGRRVTIVLHGYDWPVPDGRPALPPAWLKPVFDAKAYTRLDDARAVMKQLIQRLNAMQVQLIAELGRPNLHHIDLQGTLQSADHRKDWQNELHPTIPAGFAEIATVFSRQLLAIRAVDYGGKAPY